MAERIFLYGAVLIAVVVVGLSQAQAMLHMLSDQSRNQNRRLGEIGAQGFDWHDLEEGQRISVRCYKHPENGPTITAISKIR